MNRIRSQNRINVHGCDVPDPVCTFEELQSEYRLNPRVLQNLKDAGLSSPTPIQMQAIPLMMHVSTQWHTPSVICKRYTQTVLNCVTSLCQGREVLACAPTGSGKTLAFCLPLLARLQQPANLGFRAVIISPTRELASQVNAHKHTHTYTAVCFLSIVGWGVIILGLGYILAYVATAIY